MEATSGPEASTIRLTAATETADAKANFANLTRGEFDEWPNDAGFDGLTETRGPVQLKVQGSIPVWAAGSLYRTGPGVNEVEDTKAGAFRFSHWFDGLAHTHRFDIVANHGESKNKDQPSVQVCYTSRRQTDAIAQEIRSKGLIEGITFGQQSDPCVGMFGKFMTMFRRSTPHDNIAVTVNANMRAFRRIAVGSNSSKAADDQSHSAGSPADTFFLGSDVASFCECDSQTLEPVNVVRQNKLHSDLKGQVGPAHGMVDPETGDYFSFNQEFGLRTTYRVFRVSAATGATTILATFRGTPAYIHSFFLTHNYVVICLPVAHYVSGLKIMWQGNLLNSFKEFDPTESCRWYVIDRRHGQGIVAEFTSPASFFFHTANAYEESGTGDICCDVITYLNSKIIHAMYYDVLTNRNGAGAEYWQDPLKAECRPRLTRFRFRKQYLNSPGVVRKPLPVPEIDLEIQGPHAGDMPTINPAYSTKEHRYVYMMVLRGHSTMFDSIAKLDTLTRDVLLWAAPQGHTPSEAIFVARPAEAGETPAEDDGVLLSVVLDGKNRKSHLLCLDAKTMTELGRAECDFAVAIGLHGQHVRDKE